MKKSFWVSISLIFIFLFVKSIFDLTPSFGANKNISGIDISHHNNIRDWGQLKNSIDFVFIKATEGRSHKDSKFKKFPGGIYRHVCTYVSTIIIKNKTKEKDYH